MSAMSIGHLCSAEDGILVWGTRRRFPEDFAAEDEIWYA